MRFVIVVALLALICGHCAAVPRDLRKTFTPRFAQVRAGCTDLSGATFAKISSGNNGQVLKMTKSTTHTALKISGKDLSSHDFKVQDELSKMPSQPFFKSAGESFSCDCKDVPKDVKDLAKAVAQDKGKTVPDYSDGKTCYFLDQPLLGADLSVSAPSTAAEKKSVVFQIFFAYHWAKKETGFSHSDPNDDNYVLTENALQSSKTKFCFSADKANKKIWCIPSADTGGKIVNIIDFGQSGTTKNPQSSTRVGKQSTMIEKMGLKGMVGKWDKDLSDAVNSGNNWLDTLSNSIFDSYKVDAVPSDGQCFGDC